MTTTGNPAPPITSLYGLRSIKVTDHYIPRPEGHAYLPAFLVGKMRRLKWEWRVTYEFNWTGEWETGHYELFRSRKEARHFIRNQMYIHRGMIRPAPATCFRNIKIQRRLVEVDWHDYRDSFTWNSGRGKR